MNLTSGCLGRHLGAHRQKKTIEGQEGRRGQRKREAETYHRGTLCSKQAMATHGDRSLSMKKRERTQVKGRGQGRLRMLHRQSSAQGVGHAVGRKHQKGEAEGGWRKGATGQGQFRVSPAVSRQARRARRGRRQGRCGRGGGGMEGERGQQLTSECLQRCLGKQGGHAETGRELPSDVA
jgi:hypothetical protein